MSDRLIQLYKTLVELGDERMQRQDALTCVNREIRENERLYTLEQIRLLTEKFESEAFKSEVAQRIAEARLIAIDESIDSSPGKAKSHFGPRTTVCGLPASAMFSGCWDRSTEFNFRVEIGLRFAIDMTSEIEGIWTVFDAAMKLVVGADYSNAWSNRSTLIKSPVCMHVARRGYESLQTGKWQPPEGWQWG